MTETKTETKKPHEVRLRDRKTLDLTGIREVIGFDDASVSVRTDDCGLTVEGEGLRIGKFDAQSGEMTVTGNVSGIFYTESKRPDARKRLFR